MPEASLTSKKPTPKEEGAKAAVKARTALIETLDEWGETEFANKLRSCSEKILIHCIECDHDLVTEKHCKRRWCPVCARVISAERVAKFSGAIKRMNSPLFVTLTMPNVTDARAGIHEIRKAFGRWKRQKWFKELDVKGGIASLEITNRGKGWHPHLHVLLDCPWLAPSRLMPQPGDSPRIIKSKCSESQAQLSAAWATALRTETAIVHVKKAGPEIAREVLKYSVKPSDLIECADNPGDIIRAMDRTRLVTTWGSCYGLSAEIKAEAAALKEPCKCEKCGGSNWMPQEVWSKFYDRVDTTRRTYWGQGTHGYCRIHDQPE